MKQKRDREEACFTCGHYHDFEGGEPCSVCGHVIAGTESRGQHESVMPSTIIPGFLFLGSYDTASRQELLKAMNITHILNTVPNCQALYKNTFVYHTVTSTPPVFQECWDFLDEANAKNHRVLVYCMSGVSRSPAVVISYLMKLRHWRLAESYKWVKDKRPTVNISHGDASRLVDLELQLCKSCSVPFGLEAVTLPGMLPQPAAQQQQQQAAQPLEQQQPGQAQAQQQAAGVFGAAPHAPPAPLWPAPPACAAPLFGAAPLTFCLGAAPPRAFVFGKPQAHEPGGSEMET